MNLELRDSAIVEKKHKRVPKRKAARVLIAVREKISMEIKVAVKERKFHVPTDKVAKLRKLDERIEGYYIREDGVSNKNQMSLMDLWSDERTTVCYYDWRTEKTMVATFIGTIAEAKANLRVTQRISDIKWAHYRHADQQLVRGMWQDMNVY